MALPDFSQQLQRNQQCLQRAAQSLKQEFTGLDEIIDRVIRLMTPWYLFPEWQKRPTIINLWGMTGVGKTSLVKRLVELLEMPERFYLFDMGNNSERVDTLKSFFKSLCKDQSGFPFILGLDEFQYANTKSQKGDELEKAYSRVVWELLDTGRFQVFRDQFGRSDIAGPLAELKFLLARGVKVQSGFVTEGAEYYLKVAAQDRFWRGRDNNDEIDIEVKGTTVKLSKKLQFVKEDLIQDFYEHCGDLYQHKTELKDHLLQLDGPQTVALLEKILQHSNSRKEVDCSKALIFIMGNLDEAYHFSHIVNPDISADEFHKRSQSISISHIKSALQKRFRHEQIARLGNNHIIYPALNQKGFEQIISRELNRMARQAKEDFDLELSFHKTVHQLIYKEGVFPTQGTRPLFSTLQQLIDPFVALLPATISEFELSCARVELSFQKSCLWLLFYDKDGTHIHTELETPDLQLSTIRSSKSDELQAVTAVHESGHAVASALLMGNIPTQIFSVSADQSASGMVLTENKERMVWSKQLILQRAAVCLAGQAAEKLIFGEEHLTAGSESDIKAATHLVSNLVKRQGLAGSIISIGVEEAFTGSVVYDNTYEFNNQVKSLLQAAEEMAEEVLKKHKPLLLSLSQYLAKNTYMSRNRFLQYLKKHAASQNTASLLPKPFSYKEKLLQAIRPTQPVSAIALDPSFVCLNKSNNSHKPD